MEEDEELTKEEMQELKNLLKSYREIKNSNNKTSPTSPENQDNKKAESVSTDKSSPKTKKKSTTEQTTNNTTEYWQVADKNGKIIEDEEKLEELEYNYSKKINPNNSNRNNKNKTSENTQDNKSAVGFLCGIFLSLIISLIIGFCAYPYGSYARETFFKGLTWAFVVDIFLGFILTIVYIFVISGNY